MLHRSAILVGGVPVVIAGAGGGGQGGSADGGNGAATVNTVNHSPGATYTLTQPGASGASGATGGAGAPAGFHLPGGNHGWKLRGGDRRRRCERHRGQLVRCLTRRRSPLPVHQHGRRRWRWRVHGRVAGQQQDQYDGRHVRIGRRRGGVRHPRGYRCASAARTRTVAVGPRCRARTTPRATPLQARR